MCMGVDPTIGVITPFKGVGPPPAGVKDQEDPEATLVTLIWGVFLGVCGTNCEMGGVYFIGNCTGGIALGTLGWAPDVGGIPAEIPGFTEGVNTCFFNVLSFSGFKFGSKGLECP